MATPSWRSTSRPTPLRGGNEGRERIRLSDTGGAYERYSIPLEAFFQTGATPQLANVYNFVFTFVELTGDGNTGTTEFEFAIDALGFGTQAGAVAGEAPPRPSPPRRPCTPTPPLAPRRSASTSPRRLR